MCNGQLITLFWQMGEILQRHPAQLPDNRGSSFSKKNLNAMVEFYRSFPDLRIAGMLSSFITWKHLLILLEEKNAEARKFYVWLTVENDLTLAALRRKIAAKTFDTYEAGKNKALKLLKAGSPEKFYTEVVSARLRRPLPEFKPSSLTEFWKIIEKEQNSVQIIAKFIDTQHRTLNASLNKLFWEIGKFINENSVQPPKKLAQFAAFNAEILEQTSAYRISHLLPFDYILAILHVQPIEAKLFYARIAASQGLSLAALKKKIAADEFSHTAGAKEREQELIVKMNNPITETKITKSRNSTEIITYEYADYGDDIDSSQLITNIFKNPYFTNFLKTS